MFEGHDLFISDLLSAHGWLEPSGLAEAQKRQAAGTGSLAAALVELGLIDREKLFDLVADHLGGTHLRKIPREFAPGLLAQLEGGLARRLGVVPVAEAGGALLVAAVDPLRAELAGDLAFFLGRPIRLAVAEPAAVAQAIARGYPEPAPPAPETTGENPTGSMEDDALSVAEMERQAGQSAVVDFVNRVLEKAILAKASDIHFEPFERVFQLRYRVDGTLLELPSPARALAGPVVSRLKILAQLNITERRRPQDGRIRLNVGGRAVDLRVSTLPTQFGESVVLRVLDSSATQLSLAQLGLPETIRASLEAVIRQPHGIVVVTGPTGSGKTTSLYSCLTALNAPDVKLLTIEDPVEYEIPGVMQVPVNPAAGLTFARALRSFLRQDPDIVMVGEIRDLETAQIAIQASLTGHLVLTTLHTNDAPSAVTRLLDLGIEPFLLASTLEGVLAQRLVRRICPGCRQATVPAPGPLRLLGLGPTQEVFAGRGCADCHQTGYRGRLGLFEYIRVTDPLRELVGQSGSLIELRRQAAVGGMTTLRSAGLDAICAGFTTMEEILKYT